MVRRGERMTMEIECFFCNGHGKLIAADHTTGNLISVIEDESNVESEHIKEVYAKFGLAIYYAQVLEHQIVNTLLAIIAKNGEIHSSQEIDIFFEKNFAHTMGTLIKALTNKKILSEQAIEELRKAKIIRDNLVHNYFKDNIELMVAQRGREKMIDEFDRAVTIFTRVDNILTVFADEIFSNLGITRQKQEEIYKEMMDEWKSKHY